MRVATKEVRKLILKWRTMYISRCIEQNEQQNTISITNVQVAKQNYL